MEIGQIQQRRLSDNIVEQLETMILEGTLQPGQRLPAERALAEQFGVRPSLPRQYRNWSPGLVISRQGGGTTLAIQSVQASAIPCSAVEGHPEAHRDLLEFRHTAGRLFTPRCATDLDRAPAERL